jgi:hypothetical protein
VYRQVAKADYAIGFAGYAPGAYLELAWYASDDDKVLGVLLLHKKEETHSWVVLAEDEDEGPGFYGTDLAHSIESEEDATAQLQQAMTDQCEIQKIKGGG